MLIAVVLHRARDGHCFAVGRANIGMKILTDGVLGQPISDGFAVLLDLKNVLAFRADVQGAFTTGQQAGEGDGCAGIVRERLRSGDHPEQTGREQDHDIFHIFGSLIVFDSSLV